MPAATRATGPSGGRQDLDPDKADRVDEVSRAIYAAATRARSHLTVVGDPDVCEAYGFDALAGALRAPG